MVTDQQVRRLKQMLSEQKSLAESACRSGMSEKTARKYRDSGKMPSELKSEHTWRTRKDPFKGDWPEIIELLETSPKLEALTIFQYLQRKNPGRYQDGQLRTLQRKIKRWRALEGPPKDVVFPQEHHPGRLSQSDFTHMGSLGITIANKPFDHLLYHFILTKSNWETVSICFSESFESLSEGFQNAIWELGGVPERHQTDCLSTAVNKDGNPEEFTKRYSALMKHYNSTPMKINPGKGNENGDVEQSHYRFKNVVDQELMLRGSRNFNSREEYEQFLRKLLRRRNAGRKKLLELEMSKLQPLPSRKLDSFTSIPVRVSPRSTVLVHGNTYSVNSRLIGETVHVKVYAEYLEIEYAQKVLDRIPRLRGKKKHCIQYRHVIDSLLKKPGAFENYKYKQDMFPTTRFRMVYDGLLKAKSPRTAAKEYLHILNLAAKENESLVDDAIRHLIQAGTRIIDSTAVNEVYSDLKQAGKPKKPGIDIPPVNLTDYDTLFTDKEALWLSMN
jgi:hypothetical protein